MATRQGSDEDGLGQSMVTELRWWWRWRSLSRRVIRWRKPERAEKDAIDGHPQMGRFGDFTIAVSEFEGYRAVVRERMWSGWPGPSTFVVFVYEGEHIWTAWDFYEWPECWERPRA